MDPSAQTLDQFLAFCKSKQLTTAVIAPASSFIGLHIAEALLAQNLGVCCLAVDGNLRQQAAYLFHNPHFFVLEQDTSKVVAQNQTVLLDHLSAISPKYIIYDLDETIRTIPNLFDIVPSVTKQTNQLLNYAREQKSIVVMLSRIEFGADNPFQHNPSSGQRQIRDIKVFVNSLLAQATHDASLNARSITYGDLYGPYMDLDEPSEVSVVVNAVVNRQKILLPGDGLSILRPVYISDFVYAAVRTLFTPETSGKQYSLINPQETTELVFAKTAQQQAASLGIFADIVFTQDHKTPNISQRIAYDDAIVKAIGWEPKVPLAEGIHNTLQSFLPEHAATPSVVAPQVPVAPPPQSPTPIVAPPLPTPPASVPQISHLIEPAPSPQQFPAPSVQPAVSVTTPTPPVAPAQPVPAVTPPPAISTPTKDTLPKEKSPKPAKRSRTFGVIGALLLILIGIVALLMVPYSLHAYFQHAVNRNFQNPIAVASDTKQLATLQTDIHRAQKIVPFMQPSIFLLKRQQQIDQDQIALIILQYSVAGQLAYQSAKVATGAPSTPDSHSIQASIAAATVQIQVAQQDFALAQAYQKIAPANSPYAASLANAQKMRQASQAQVDALKQTLSLMSAMFGESSTRTIAVLPIDETTLRPGGGTIDGVVPLTLAPNAQPAITVVSADDPRLSVAIPASDALKATANISSISFTQSLWQPQFDVAMTPFYATINSLTGGKLQGVMGIDLLGLQQLLSLTGPVTVNDPQNATKQITVSADNLQTLVSTWYGTSADIPVVPKTIAQITKQVFAQALSANVSFATLAQTVQTLYTQQHVVFMSQDPAIVQQVRSAVGSLQTFPSNGDFFKVVTANLDANQLSMAVKDTIHQDFVVSSTNTVSQRLVITYTNENPSTNSAVTYHGLSQIYFPATTKVSRVVVDNKKQPVTAEDTALTKTISVPITIAAGTTTTVTIEYQAAQPFVFADTKATYHLTVLKQTGTDDTPYELNLQLPANYKVDTSAAPFDHNTDGYLLKTTIDQPKTITIAVIK